MTAPAASYLEPGTGFDSLKDAVALVRCVAAEDGEGIAAVANGSDNPRVLAVLLGVITVRVCHMGRLDDAGIEALLAAVSADVSDYLLDQESPAGEVSSHR